jgi:predicted nucleic acid-binding protein
VHQELLTGLERGKTHLEPVIQAITEQEIEVLALSPDEEQLTQDHPRKLNTGERQAIALAQMRKATLLCNDKRAIRYCQQLGISTVNLANILRLLWIRQLMSKSDVRAVIAKMEQVENLTLTSAQRMEIFAPHRRT